MSKYRAIYDSKGLACEYVDGQLVWVRSDLTSPPQRTGVGFPTIMGDLEPFVSPIDGTVVAGRAALREHCLRHNVVPTADLKGLPMRTVNQEYSPTPEQREQTRQIIAEVIRSKY